MNNPSAPESISAPISIADRLNPRVTGIRSESLLGSAVINALMRNLDMLVLFCCSSG